MLTSSFEVTHKGYNGKCLCCNARLWKICIAKSMKENMSECTS